MSPQWLRHGVRQKYIIEIAWGNKMNELKREQEREIVRQKERERAKGKSERGRERERAKGKSERQRETESKGKE